MRVYTDRIFPRLLDWASSHFDDDRAAVLAHARGRVLELGVGTGSSLGFYPEGVTEVVGIDPHEPVLERARQTLEVLDRPYRITLEAGDAQRLPHADASFDTVVAFLSLCTIPDPLSAAREARRVLRPDGRLLVLEHVRAEPGSRLARWQRRLTPLWHRVAAGCHLDRDTAETLAAAGFDVAALERYSAGRSFSLAAPRIRGVLARDPGGPATASSRG